MIAETLNSYGLSLDYLRRLLADIPEDRLAHQPSGVPNHPLWTIGHLTYSCQAIAGEVGLAAWLPANWEQRFGTGSVPLADRSQYPPLANLLAALGDGQARLSGHLTTIGEAALAALLPDERYRSIFPTVGHAVVHILCSHTAMHVGQVIDWRRAADYPPLPGMFV